MYVAKKKKQLSSCKLFNEKILIGRLFLRLVFFFVNSHRFAIGIRY